MSHALTHQVLDATTPSRRLARAFGLWAIGIFTLAALARISVPLPGTPVPLTGQTLGVALIALACGRRLGSAIVAGYLAAGILGLPVFAHGTPFVNGTTSGYLVGMVLASVVTGTLADLGWTRTWAGAAAAAYLGSAVIFTCGLIVLSYFVPREALLGAGLYPFILSDSLKNLLAVNLVRAVSKSR